MSPIEKMIDDECTEHVDPPNPIPENIPYTVRKGVLDFAGIKFRCYVLSDGRRIIDNEDFENFLAFR